MAGRSDVLLNVASHILEVADRERLGNRELVAVVTMVHNLVTVRDDSDEAITLRQNEEAITCAECSDTVN